jgi:hypothetical protein
MPLLVAYSILAFIPIQALAPVGSAKTQCPKILTKHFQQIVQQFALPHQPILPCKLKLPRAPTVHSGS